VSAPNVPSALADAADVLSDQLRTHLRRLAVLVRPHADVLEKRFVARLQALHFGPKQRTALAALTSGAAARMLARGNAPAEFLEQVEYNGRRLAKLNLPPSAIVEALAEYDRLLTPMLERLAPDEYANLKWVREQLQFCVILTLNRAYYQVREMEAQAFYQLFRAELEAGNLDELLARCLAVLSRFCRAREARLFFVNDEESGWILKAAVNGSERTRGKPVNLCAIPNRTTFRKQLDRPRLIRVGGKSDRCLLDPDWVGRFASCWSVPLISASRVAGVMQFGFPKVYDWLPREQELLEAAAERCMVAAEKARLVENLSAQREQIRSLAEHMLQVEEVERRRISRELHDEAGQSLLYLRLQLELLEQELPDESPSSKKRVSELRELTERTILEIRRLISALSPAVLEQLGLAAAIRQLVNRFRQMQPCRVRLHLAHLEQLPRRIEDVVYRLVQECCNNIAKHSFASNVNISVTSADGMLRLYVEDDGVGFLVEQAFGQRDSFGLAGMRERVMLLGGNLKVQSGSPGRRTAHTNGGKRSGHGTKITVELPVPKHEEDRWRDKGSRPPRYRAHSNG
jgi:signal transduction histidine kinase